MHRFMPSVVPLVRSTIAAGLLIAGTATALAAQSMSTDAGKKTAMAALTWGPAPAVFPAGARMAVVSGDPSQAAPFVVRLQFPNGYRIPPHFHPTDEKVMVRTGQFIVGMGDTIMVAKGNRMRPGKSGTIAANMHHWAVARGKTTVQVSAVGPFQMTYVNASDDPQKSTGMK